MSVPILQRHQDWTCPNCSAVDRTFDPRPHTRFHACPGLKGLTAPMVPAGTRAKVEAVDRQDYVGRDIVTRDGDGRVVMAVQTIRDDGNDVAVYAPCATAGGKATDARGD